MKKDKRRNKKSTKKMRKSKQEYIYVKWQKKKKRMKNQGNFWQKVENEKEKFWEE